MSIIDAIEITPIIPPKNTRPVEKASVQLTVNDETIDATESNVRQVITQLETGIEAVISHNRFASIANMSAPKTVGEIKADQVAWAEEVRARQQRESYEERQRKADADLLARRIAKGLAK